MLRHQCWLKFSSYLDIHEVYHLLFTLETIEIMTEIWQYAENFYIGMEIVRSTTFIMTCSNYSDFFQLKKQYFFSSYFVSHKTKLILALISYL